MMLTGAFAFASRIASVVSAMARSRSPLARQITARLVNGCGNVGSSRIASLMSASAPSRSPSARFEMPRFCQENADGGPSLDRLIVVGDRLGVFALGAPGVAAVVKDDAARRPDPQRVVEIRDRDVVLALVVIGRAAQIVGGDAGMQADRFAGIRDHLRVIAFLVPADRAPEIDGRELLAGKHLQRDDLVAGVDLLIGRRGVGGAERPELRCAIGRGKAPTTARRRAGSVSGLRGASGPREWRSRVADTALLPPAERGFKAGRPHAGRRRSGVSLLGRWW